MKKKNLVLGALAVISLFIFSILVSAQSSPMPINGILEGKNVGYQPIKVTNLRTSVSMSEITSIGGQYLIEWANSGDNYRSGDRFRVEVTSCSSTYPDDCIQTLTYNDQPELFTIFDLTNLVLDCPSCPSTSCHKECPSCPTTSCPDPVIYDDAPGSSIPDCPTCDESVCDDPICPPTTKPKFSDSISSIILAIAAMGGGLKVYRNRAGGVTTIHRHRGILMYHNPDTQHRNVLYRHAALSKNEEQYKKDMKRIEGL